MLPNRSVRPHPSGPISITDGSVHDAHFLDQIVIEPGSIYVVDRGYLDFARLYRIEQERASLLYVQKQHQVQRPEVPDRQINHRAAMRPNHPPEHMEGEARLPCRSGRISYVDPQKAARGWSSYKQLRTVRHIHCSHYKSRWQTELFFKWIKQNLRIKAFRTDRERSSHPNLICNLRLPDGRLSQ